MKPWRSIGALPYLFILLVACGVAWACQMPSPQQIENALQASPNAEFSTQILLYGGDADERSLGATPAQPIVVASELDS